MIFSILVVCLNPGDKLRHTIESVLEQTESDYEILVKDGGSTDGCMAMLPPDERIRVVSQKDRGIYDAMNQAVAQARGEYFFFLNCGDCFCDAEVLAKVGEHIRSAETQYAGEKRPPFIFYGNIEEEQTGAVVQSNPSMDDFGCYRNVPCHQASFYSKALFAGRGFDLSYRVRADYEHFLWAYYKAGAKTLYMPVTVSRYEGGGFSETRENRKISEKEHREIVKKYMPSRKVYRYRLIMLLTLSGLRTWIARNPVTAGAYNKIKRLLYKA